MPQKKDCESVRVLEQALAMLPGVDPEKVRLHVLAPLAPYLEKLEGEIGAPMTLCDIWCGTHVVWDFECGSCVSATRGPLPDGPDAIVSVGRRAPDGTWRFVARGKDGIPAEIESRGTGSLLPGCIERLIVYHGGMRNDIEVLASLKQGQMLLALADKDLHRILAEPDPDPMREFPEPMAERILNLLTPADKIVLLERLAASRLWAKKRVTVTCGFSRDAFPAGDCDVELPLEAAILVEVLKSGRDPDAFPAETPGPLGRRLFSDLAFLRTAVHQGGLRVAHCLASAGHDFSSREILAISDENGWTVAHSTADRLRSLDAPSPGLDRETMEWRDSASGLTVLDACALRGAAVPWTDLLDRETPPGGGMTLYDRLLKAALERSVSRAIVLGPHGDGPRSRTQVQAYVRAVLMLAAEPERWEARRENPAYRNAPTGFARIFEESLERLDILSKIARIRARQSMESSVPGPEAGEPWM